MQTYCHGRRSFSRTHATPPSPETPSVADPGPGRLACRKRAPAGRARRPEGRAVAQRLGPRDLPRRLPGGDGGHARGAGVERRDLLGRGARRPVPGAGRINRNARPAAAGVGSGHPDVARSPAGPDLRTPRLRRRRAGRRGPQQPVGAAGDPRGERRLDQRDPHRARDPARARRRAFLRRLAGHQLRPAASRTDGLTEPVRPGANLLLPEMGGLPAGHPRVDPAATAVVARRRPGADRWQRDRRSRRPPGPHDRRGNEGVFLRPRPPTAVHRRPSSVPWASRCTRRWREKARSCPIPRVRCAAPRSWCRGRRRASGRVPRTRYPWRPRRGPGRRYSTS